MKDYTILELNDICKSFPGILALDKVSFNLKNSEIHAIVGENGAGKSTLIKIVTGVYQPDSGTIKIENKLISIKNPSLAIDLGIAVIYQELALFPDLSVAENIYFHDFPKNKAIKAIRWRDLYKNADNILKRLGINFSSRTVVGELSIAQRQLVEIARAIAMDTRIIIMDEPTSALNTKEIEDLLKIIKNLKESGKSIIFISHKLDEVFKIADRITVLRDGNHIGTECVDKLNMNTVVKMMVGRELRNLFPKEQVKIGEEVLKVENLTRKGIFKKISFTVKKGEILGIVGLIGAGRTELVRAIFGADNVDSGKIFLNKKEIKIDSPQSAVDRGIALIPEDRQLFGSIKEMTITENITLPILDGLRKFIFIDSKREKKIAKEKSEYLDVKSTSLDQKVENLSGGNQQKVVIAKWLSTDPKILIVDEPTRGIDVGAKAEVHKIMSLLASGGISIIMVSSELPEILGMSDRILVMHEGRITAELKKEDASQEKIMRAAAGLK